MLKLDFNRMLSNPGSNILKIVNRHANTIRVKAKKLAALSSIIQLIKK